MNIEQLKEKTVYDGMPQAWQRGFNVAVREMQKEIEKLKADLLAALESMVAWSGKRGGDDDALLPADQQDPEVAQAMQAIAKARGANQMKLLTANLTGKALDWALAKAMNADKVWIDHGYVDVNARFHLHVYEPFNHTDHALCMGLIKSHIYKITATHGGWEAFSDSGNRQFSDDTLEQAVARCVVAMRLGDEVDVPEELVGEKS